MHNIRKSSKLHELKILYVSKILFVSLVVDKNILRSFSFTELMHGRLVLVIGFERSIQGKVLRPRSCLGISFDNVGDLRIILNIFDV